jgi:WD40 repeat protein
VSSDPTEPPGDSPGRHPGLADGHRTRGVSSPRLGEARIASSEANERTLPLESGAASLPQEVRATDDYQAGEEVARGGLGRILRAFDKRLRRSVALKELIGSDPGANARFLREARITAQLQHPSIVPIYQAGQWPDGKPFYAMKLISGLPLKDAIGSRETVGARMTLLPNVLAVAEAIAYAHDKRIIHRDIKPANVVLGPFGETMVIDWGLAKELDDPTPDSGSAAPVGNEGADATVPGTIVGTPAFMAPEQARGEPVDQRADVYALGALLYQLMAGDPPYSGASSADVIKSVVSGPPIAVERRVPGVPAELAAIVQKAMARDPAARYSDGAAFAADLKRYLSGQLVSAHEYSLLGRAARFVERHKLPVALSAAFAVLLSLFGVFAFVRILDERNRAQARSNEMVLAGARATLERDPTAALAWLKRYPLEGTGWEEARSLMLDAMGSGFARHIFMPKEGPWFGAFSPDGRLYALVMDDPVRVELREVKSGRLVRSLTVDFANRLRFAADGRRLVWRNQRSHPPSVMVWDLDQAKPRSLPLGAEAEENEFDVAADGRTAVVGLPSGEVRKLDLERDAPRTLGKLPGPVQQVMLSADGRVAAAVTRAGDLIAWTLADGRAQTMRAGGELVGLEITRDGAHVVAYGKKLEVFTIADGRRVELAADKDYVGNAAFSRDGRLLAAAGPDRLIRIWDWRKGSLQTFEGHTRDINMMTFDASGERLASASRDGTVRVWDVRSGTSLILRGHGSQVAAAEFSADGEHLASVSADRSTRLWSVPRDFEAAVHVHMGEVWDVQLLDDEHTLTTGHEDSTVTVADLATGAVRNVAEPKGMAGDLEVAPGRDLYAASTDDGQVILWRKSTNQTRMIPFPGGVYGSLAFSCDGKALAAALGDGSLRLLDVATGGFRTLAEKVTDGGRLTWSPDCKFIAGHDSTHRAILVWDVREGRARSLPAHTGTLHRQLFVDERRLVSGSWDGMMRLSDVTSGQSRVLPGHRVVVIDLALSPNRSTLASSDGNGEVRLWNTSTWTSRLLVGHTRAVNTLAFSPDGKRLLSGSSDRSLRLWDVASGVQLQSIQVGDTVVRARFTSDGAHAVSVDNIGMVKKWRLTPEAPPDRDPRRLRELLLGATTVVERGDRSIASPGASPVEK